MKRREVHGMAKKPATGVRSIKDMMNSGDVHIVVNGEAKTLEVYKRDGRKVFSCEARCFGQHPDWTTTNGDTPPGLYKAGKIFDTRGEAAYGNYCIDLIDLEGQETGNGRGGISVHGGGSGLANPFELRQGWQATHGCIRLQNEDNEKVVEIIHNVQRLGFTAYLQVYYPKGKLD